jgi:hypothetical protein
MSDSDYETVTDEIFSLADIWISEEGFNIDLIRQFITSLNANKGRLSQNKIVNFSMQILRRRYYRFFDSCFELLSKLDISAMPANLLDTLLSDIRLLLGDEKLKNEDQHLKRLFIKIRKQRDEHSSEIDKLVEQYYPDFYKGDYHLEVFPGERATHIQPLIDSMSARNKVQGRGGQWIGFVDDPYLTIKNILDFDKISLSEETLGNLLREITSTLLSETQTHRDKLNAMQLLLFLKRAYNGQVAQ